MEKERVNLEFLSGEVETYVGEYEIYLRDHLSYTGQFDGLRRMGMRLFGAEKIAALSDRRLADEIQKYFAVVTSGDEEFVLVKRDKLEEYRKLVWVISR